jgi:glycosyltransferase involved in cell wall biosynthesis
MRTGGPAGYLLELRRQAEESSHEGRHRVRFPGPGSRPEAPRGPSPVLRQLRQWKRALLGTPRFYRPSREDMNREGGVIDELLMRAAEDAVEICRPSFDGSADALFVHDVFALEEVRRSSPGSAIWLMIHSPMPVALYLAWNWGHPEWPWEEIAALPDVRRWIDKELVTWNLADRVVLPCPEALEDLARVDARFAEAAVRLEYLLTGSSAVEPESAAGERAGEPVGLFLGSDQAYRGLDVLLNALALLPARRDLPGQIAFAGPKVESIPSHPRARRLGRVDDIPALLAGVDFLVNTNRFSLFDLSNIEAAAAGKPLLLHAVGGNKALARLGAGCRLFEPLSPETLATALTEMFSMSREALEALGARSRECYSRHLTAKAMWLRHLELYDKAESRVAV